LLSFQNLNFFKKLVHFLTLLPALRFPLKVLLYLQKPVANFVMTTGEKTIVFIAVTIQGHAVVKL